jgi:hypothetical protein
MVVKKTLAAFLKATAGFVLLQPLLAAAQQAASVAMRVASGAQVQEDPGWPPAMVAVLFGFLALAGVFAVAIVSISKRRDRALEEQVQKLALEVEKLRNQSR